MKKAHNDYNGGKADISVGYGEGDRNITIYAFPQGANEDGTFRGQYMTEYGTALGKMQSDSLQSLQLNMADAPKQAYIDIFRDEAPRGFQLIWVPSNAVLRCKGLVQAYKLNQAAGQAAQRASKDAARALVDAGYMPMREYVQQFGE